jgi:prepilin-type N-terminal cleavage/methylation domain-containing protein
MRKGFTLVELVVVMVIIGILISFAIPQYATTVERSRAAEGVSLLGAIRTSQIRYFAQNESYCLGAGSLDIDISAPRFFDAPLIDTGGPHWDITRNGVNNGAFGSYTLSIDENGTITCSGGSAGACTKLGY